MPDNIGLWGMIAVLLIDKSITWFGKNNSKLQESIDSLNLTIVRLDSTIKYMEKRLEKLEDNNVS